MPALSKEDALRHLDLLRAAIAERDNSAAAIIKSQVHANVIFLHVYVYDPALRAELCGTEPGEFDRPAPAARGDDPAQRLTAAGGQNPPPLPGSLVGGSPPSRRRP